MVAETFPQPDNTIAEKPQGNEAPRLITGFSDLTIALWLLLVLQSLALFAEHGGKLTLNETLFALADRLRSVFVLGLYNILTIALNIFLLGPRGLFGISLQHEDFLTAAVAIWLGMKIFARSGHMTYARLLLLTLVAIPVLGVMSRTLEMLFKLWGRPDFASSTLLIAAILAWALAELLTRKRRLALTSAVLSAIFAGSAFMLGGAEAALAASVLHYIRFKVSLDIAFAAGAVLLEIYVSALLGAWWIEPYAPLFLWLGGCVVLGLAVGLDLADKPRRTEKADIAFWLHFLAAPIIIYPIMSKLTFLKKAGGPMFRHYETLVTSWFALAILALFAGFILFALLLNRRIMPVMILPFALLSLAQLVGRAGFPEWLVYLMPLSMIALAVALSIGWRPLRRVFLKLLPAHLAQRLPHPILSAS